MSQEKFLDAVAKVVESILKEKNLLVGEWHLGTVSSVISSYVLSVFVNGSSTAQVIPCNPNIPFSNGDEVWVHFVNGDSSNKFVPYKRATGLETLTGISGGGSGGSGGSTSSIIGDMLKSIYDANNNGIVDNAEAVNGKVVDDTKTTSNNLWTASQTNSAITSAVSSSTNSDKNFVFNQNTPSSSWVISHNLNKYVTVTIVDSAENVVVGDILYNSLNQITVNFSGAFSGIAYIN